MLSLDHHSYSYIGVRYAEPPVENQRFKKPIEAQGWSGIREANRTGSMCFQGTFGKSMKN